MEFLQQLLMIAAIQLQHQIITVLLLLKWVKTYVVEIVFMIYKYAIHAQFIIVVKV